MSKVQNIIEQRVVNGEWIGAHHDGKPVVKINGEILDAVAVAKQCGIKIKTKKADKYRKDDADLGTTFHQGHSEDGGDGIGESEE